MLSPEDALPLLHPTLIGAGGALVLLNLIAIGATRWYRRRPLVSVVLLGGLAWSASSQHAITVGDAVGQYLLGQPLLHTNGSRPDPTTRLETVGVSIGCCICDPRWERWNDDTLLVLTRLFGPGPTAYDGPYPDTAEAQRLIASGTRPVISGEQMWVAGQPYPIWATTAEQRARREQLAADWPVALSAWMLVDLEIEAEQIERAVPLRDDAVLLAVADGIQLRIWDGEGRGRIWASYPAATAQ